MSNLPRELCCHRRSSSRHGCSLAHFPNLSSSAELRQHTPEVSGTMVHRARKTDNEVQRGDGGRNRPKCFGNRFSSVASRSAARSVANKTLLAVESPSALLEV